MKKFLILIFVLFITAIRVNANNISFHDSYHLNSLGLHQKLQKANNSSIENTTTKDINQNINEGYYFNNLGVEKLRAGDYKDALDNFNKAIELGLNNEQIYFNIALAKAGQKDYTGAIEYCNKVIAINPNSDAKKLLYAIGQEYTNIANNKFDKRDYTNAIIYYTKAISINKHDSNLYVSRGNAKYNIENYKGAAEDYTLSIKLNPSNVNAYINRSDVYLILQNYNESLKDINSAIKIKPNDAELYYRRGSIYEKRGLYKEAISDFEKSININPNQDTSNSLARIKKQLTKMQIEKYKKILLDNIPILFIFIYSIIYLIKLTIKPTSLKLRDFKRYNFTEIMKHYNSIYKKGITLNSQAPKPIDFGIESDIDNIERAYIEIKWIKRFCKCGFWESFEEHNKFGPTLLGISCLIPWLINHYYTNLVPFWVAAILFIVLYKPIKHIFVLLKTLKINLLYEYTDIDAEYYLLYKGVNDYFESNLDMLIKKTEEEKEKKLTQEYNQWKKYWAEKQKNGFKFEEAVGELFYNLGYKVTITKGTGDEGVDLILRKGPEKIIVQCKAYINQAGPGPVRELWGVMDDFKADRALFIAYSGVTSGAKKFAIGKELKFMDANDLINLSIQAHSEKV